MLCSKLFFLHPPFLRVDCTAPCPHLWLTLLLITLLQPLVCTPCQASLSVRSIPSPHVSPVVPRSHLSFPQFCLTVAQLPLSSVSESVLPPSTHPLLLFPPFFSFRTIPKQCAFLTSFVSFPLLTMRSLSTTPRPTGVVAEIPATGTAVTALLAPMLQILGCQTASAELADKG